MRPGATTKSLRSPRTRTSTHARRAAGCGCGGGGVASIVQPLPSKTSSMCIRQSAGSFAAISSIGAPVRRSGRGPNVGTASSVANGGWTTRAIHGACHHG